jgi:hypothetical protein
MLLKNIAANFRQRRACADKDAHNADKDAHTQTKMRNADKDAQRDLVILSSRP